MPPRSLVRLVACALVALGCLAAVATGASQTQRPTNRDQSLHDGCQRPSFVDLTLVNSPEWVYVNKNPGVSVAEGISRVTHPSEIDQPGTHSWYDLNSNLVVDKRYSYLVAGNRAAHLNNYAGDDEETGRLHYEWETGSVPSFAWPGEGDRTKIWGSWIWDCGHWITDGQVTGERTEFHPLSGIVVNRGNPYQARAGESETDAYISSDGTYAHSSEKCARNGTPQSNGTYGTNFFKCVRHHANLLQPLARSYNFFVPAPRAHPAGARLVWRAQNMGHSGKLQETVRVRPNGLDVTVSPQSSRVHYGKIFFTRWSAPAKAPTRLRVTLNSLLVKQSDPDLTGDPAGAKWTLYLQLNGYWKLINDWAPSLYALQDGQRVPINKTVTVNVQPGQELWLMTMGRECDSPSGVVLFGHYVPRTFPCPFVRDESKISENNNDDPGIVLDRYRSPGAAIGAHTSASVAKSSRFPHSPPISFGTGTQGNDAYELTYTVRRG